MSRELRSMTPTALLSLQTNILTVFWLKHGTIPHGQPINRDSGTKMQVSILKRRRNRRIVFEVCCRVKGIGLSQYDESNTFPNFEMAVMWNSMMRLATLPDRKNIQKFHKCANSSRFC